MPRPRDAFDDHDAAWHGIEVYTNTRSLTLYLSIEADYQAQIKSGLDKTPSTSRHSPRPHKPSPSASTRRSRSPRRAPR